MSARNFVLVLGAMLVLCSMVGIASADSVPIAIPDFESPDAGVYPYGQIYLEADLPLLLPWHVWQGATTDPAVLGAVLPGYIVGDMAGHGDQVGYIFCGDPDVNNRPYWYQDLGTNYSAGYKYTLDLQALVTSSGASSFATEGQTLEMTLGYWAGTETAAQGPTIVAQRLIGSTEISNSWGNYSFTTDAVSGDAVGKPIVVYISQGNSPYVTGMPYYFDNVGLTYETPEPGTFVLLASGLVGLMAYAWRKRK